MKKCCLLLSLIAFALSVLAFFSNNKLSTDSGVLTLIGICTTLIVGVSVVDTLRLQQLEEKVKKLKETKETVEKMSDKLEKLKNDANIALDANWGYTLYTIQPHTAIQQVWKGLKLALLTDDCKKLKTCMEVLKHIKEEIKKNGELSKKLNKKLDNNVLMIDEDMKNARLYILVKDELDKLLRGINDITDK